MRLRTFIAPDMPSAMKQVRDALGDGAIILTSEAARGGKGVSVIAALDEKDEWQEASATKTQQRSDAHATDNIRYELQNILRFHNLPEPCATN